MQKNKHTTFFAILLKNAFANHGKINIIKTLFPYLFGIIILGLLIYKTPLHDIFISFKNIGWKILIPFSINLLSLLCYSYSTYYLTNKSIQYSKTFYNQLVGDGLNSIIPMGIVGEAFKINHLSEHIPVEKSTSIVLYDKLAHGSSGLIFTAIVSFLTYILIDISASWKYLLLLCCFIFSICAIFSISFFFGKGPNKLSNFISKKIKILENIKDTNLNPNKIIVAIICRLAGRLFGLLEFYIILQLLNIDPQLNYIFAIATFLIAGATMALFIPQGLGINEYSIILVFDLLGLNNTSAITLALIRRIRILFWGVVGVCTLFTSFLSTKYNKKTTPLM